MYLFLFVAGAVAAFLVQQKLAAATDKKNEGPSTTVDVKLLPDKAYADTLRPKSNALDRQLAQERLERENEERERKKAEVEAAATDLAKQGKSSKRIKSGKGDAVIPTGGETQSQDDYNKSFREWAAKNMAKNGGT